MKLIADSGSTKTDWIFTARGKRVHKITTQGINPFYQQTQEIRQILISELLPKLNGAEPQSIFFYGAGCSFPEKQEMLQNAFKEIWNSSATLHLNSDLVAAARALCGNKEGIACILGTGSNSCHWDGQQIIKNISPLGYILGDEGSGAVLGKLLVADLLKNQLTKELSLKFFKKYETSYEQLMNEVYKLPFPNRSLAKYTYFLHENRENPIIESIVTNSFTAFIRRNIAQYPSQLPVNFVGSVALAFQDILKNVIEREGYTLGKIIKTPIEALEEYHN